MAEIRYERNGGGPYPAGTHEMWIGPDRVRVLVKGNDEIARWKAAHDDEWKKAKAEGRADKKAAIPDPMVK